MKRYFEFLNHQDTKALRNTKSMYEKLSEKEEYLARHIVDIAFKIHKELGPGLLEVFTQSVFITSW